jgi:hypothetical protein
MAIASAWKLSVERFGKAKAIIAKTGDYTANVLKNDKAAYDRAVASGIVISKIPKYARDAHNFGQNEMKLLATLNEKLAVLDKKYTTKIRPSNPLQRAKYETELNIKKAELCEKYARDMYARVKDFTY